jgi:hypothetical protein
MGWQGDGVWRIDLKTAVGATVKGRLLLADAVLKMSSNASMLP